MKNRTRPMAMLVAAALCVSPAIALPGIASAAEGSRSSQSGGYGSAKLVVAAGETKVITATTTYNSVTIAEGGAVVAPAGYSLTLTVNGEETGSRITETGGTDTAIVPGTYRGRVVLTVTAQNTVSYSGLDFHLRQALYVGAAGVDQTKSVTAAVQGGRVSNDQAKNIKIESTGEAFDGVYVDGRDYTLSNPKIELEGNGRSDFVGYGAAIVATGVGNRITVDGAKIDNDGVVRTGVVATGGSNVVVKNSTIKTADGELPADYQSTVDLAYMEQAPWMLGIVGNARATNLLGDNTQASYINSSIYSQGWGVLSVDTGSNQKLTSINSTLTTGDEGYGSYAIGGSTEEFLGSKLNVDTYAAINRGGTIHYGDSTRQAVAALNSTLNLGLSDRELRALSERNTVINSDKWGVMWHGAGSVDIDGQTVVNTKRATFLNKGQAVDVDVDGSDGARISARDGVIFQVMEDDDPGPVMVDGKLVNQGVYHEPTGEPTKVADFDVTAVHEDDSVATFSDIDLKGNFYNGTRGNNPAGPFGPGVQGKNLVLNFTAGATVTGVLSATQTKHNVDTITAANYQELGVVTNTASAVVNNGVIVDLSGKSKWTVTGTSYLSKLTVSADSSVVKRHGSVTMTVNGVPTPIVPGTTYTGQIVVS